MVCKQPLLLAAGMQMMGAQIRECRFATGVQPAAGRRLMPHMMATD
jgi:hypothetical protein